MNDEVFATMVQFSKQCKSILDLLCVLFLSLKAYKNWAKRNGKEKKPQKLKDLSYDQLFFLGYAQVSLQ